MNLEEGYSNGQDLKALIAKHSDIVDPANMPNDMPVLPEAMVRAHLDLSGHFGRYVLGANRRIGRKKGHVRDFTVAEAVEHLGSMFGIDTSDMKEVEVPTQAQPAA